MFYICIHLQPSWRNVQTEFLCENKSLKDITTAAKSITSKWKLYFNFYSPISASHGSLDKNFHYNKITKHYWPIPVNAYTLLKIKKKQTEMISYKHKVYAK